MNLRITLMLNLISYSNLFWNNIHIFQSRFLFLVDPTLNQTDEEVLDDIFVRSRYGSKHRYVAAIQR